MVIALFALSLVLIVGGVAAVVQGFPYVRLESGLAMVIGGTTVASAGAVLLGISAAILQMRKMTEALGRRSFGDGQVPLSEPALASSTPFRAPAFEEAPPVTVEPVAATAGAAGLAGLDLAATRDGPADADRRPAIHPLPGRALEIEPPLPDLLPPAVPGPLAPPAPGEPIGADEDLFAAPEDRPAHVSAAAETLPSHDPAQEELALRPALDEPPAAPAIETDTTEAPPPSEPPDADEDKPKPDALQVVGTYASGANTYVMFANGTIQADTPRGQFTFQSLDELKEFVDSGGETSARGAA